MHLPDLTGEPTASECGACERPAKLKCGGCEKVAYCSGEHQKEHWTTHREGCQAYRVMANDQVGRYGVTTRTLNPGELILTETPVVVGPKQQTVPVCLGCYAPVDCTVFCSQCGWPVCSPACETASPHATAECAVFNEAGVRFPRGVADLSAPCPQYECITPLRLILARRSNPTRWDAEVERMESRDAERRGTPMWEVNQVNTVQFLRTACRMADRFTEGEIHRACGHLDVNSVDVRCRNGAVVRGLYPTAAMMSHSCVANTSHTISSAGVLALYASVRVDKGQELFKSYAHALESTLVRREYLKREKYFECRCQRCADPTELGTHLGSLKCNKCDSGVVMSTNPLDESAQWKCTRCEFNTRGAAVRRVVSVIQSEIDRVDEHARDDQAIEAREQLYRKYRAVLHPRHASMTRIRRSLARMYGRADGYRLDDLPDILLDRKIELCADLLRVIDVVEPGRTRARALTLYEMHAPLVLCAKSRRRFGELDDAGLREKVDEAAKCLEEAVEILEREDPDSPEGTVAVVGRQTLELLRASVESSAKKNR